MKVLLTGSRGFVGRHLHRALDARGYDVTTCDLLDGQDALDLFRADRTTYDLAFHCAAIVGGRASIDGTPLGVATNLALDSWYFRWLVSSRTRRAVFFSSSAAYPVDLQQPGLVRRLYEEDLDLNNPRLPDATYGLAKVTGERLATYAEAEGCRVLICRPFSGYGEDQDEAYPFPAFIRRAKERQDPFEIWGDGSSTRDWIHIDDLVGATLALLDADVTGPVNLGWGRATSFDELARIVCTAAGYRPQLKHRADAPRGVHHRVSDPSRMLNHYVPTITLEEGVRRALNT